MPKKVTILGIPVDAITMREAVARIDGFIEKREPVLIATANAEMLLRATHDGELCRILQGAALVTPDGAGTVWAAHHLGHAMPERVAGYDMAQELMRIAPQKGYRLYFFGSAPGVAGIEIVGTRNGFFTEADEAAIVQEIKEAQPDILLAALGVPKQEKWLSRHLRELGVPVCIGVGGTFDVMAGVMKRAPLWMQRAKLEWLFRGLMQPKRAGRLLALPKFVLKVHAEKSKNGQTKSNPL